MTKHRTFEVLVIENQTVSCNDTPQLATWTEVFEDANQRERYVAEVIHSEMSFTAKTGIMVHYTFLFNENLLAMDPKAERQSILEVKP